MAPITLVYSLLMIALGIATYFATGVKHVTALIPAFFGAAFFVLGLLGLKDNLRKHAMHLAAALGLLAFIAAMGVLVTRGPSGSPIAALEEAIMAALSAGFVGLCVRSFITARRARERREAESRVS
jgi:hypothetical protein